MPILTTVVPNFEGVPITSSQSHGHIPYEADSLAQAITQIASDLRIHHDYLQDLLTDASTDKATSVQVFETPSLPVWSPWQTV